MKSVKRTRSTFTPSHSVSLARCAVYGHTARASIRWLPNFDSLAHNFNSTAGLSSFGCSKQGGWPRGRSKQQARGRNNQGAGRAATAARAGAGLKAAAAHASAAGARSRPRGCRACAAEGAWGPLCGRCAGGPSEWPRRRRQEQASGAGSSSRRVRER